MFEYLIKWADELQEDTWEPFTHLTGSLETVNDFEIERAKRIHAEGDIPNWNKGKARAWVKSGDILQHVQGDQAVVARVAYPALVQVGDDIERNGRVFALHLQHIAFANGNWALTGIHYVDIHSWCALTTRWKKMHSEYDVSDCTELLQASTPDEIDSEIEYNEQFGLSGVQTPWITGPGMAALKATVGQKGSRTCSELPELQGLQTLIAVSDASHVKHENGTSDGAVHIQGFEDTDLSMPVWTLAFRIHGNPSSSTVCEGEAPPWLQSYGSA